MAAVSARRCDVIAAQGRARPIPPDAEALWAAVLAAKDHVNAALAEGRDEEATTCLSEL